MPDLTIALAGNPNAGKTTLFNALTGLSQGVGNWPGKTVEIKEGICRRNGHSFRAIDLPGTYSLAVFSPDEAIARDFVIGGEPNLVLNVVDASNLERNLYLTIQLLETGVPVVVALNMYDMAQSQGIRIDHERLSFLLGSTPVIPTTASRGKGISELIDAMTQASLDRSAFPIANHNNKARTVVASPDRAPVDALPSCVVCRSIAAQTVTAVLDKSAGFLLEYSPDIEEAISTVECAIQETSVRFGSTRWLALQLLEKDPEVTRRVQELPQGHILVERAIEQAALLEFLYGDDIDIVTADQRYSFVHALALQVVERPAQAHRSLTDAIDTLVTHRLLGLPIFMAIMFLMFRLVIDVSAPLLDWVDAVINGPIASLAGETLAVLNAPAWLVSLVIEGLFAGVGGVLVFVPGLLALFFFLAFLEDSGYLARVAFVLDRFMRVIGLHGKAVIPLLLGFGCAVPAVYATRTIAGRRDRLLTTLLIPLMSCSARLPVYVVFGLAFFGRHASLVIWLLYALGILIAILAGLVFTRTFLKEDHTSAFVLELPPYRLPTLKGLGMHMWENTTEFLRKAGTIIAAVSIVLWLLLNLPWNVPDTRDSYYGQASAALVPVLAPLGFEEWETSGALVSGFIAKEVIVSSLSQIYASDNSSDDLDESLTLGEEFASIPATFGQAILESGQRLISLLPGVNLIDNETETNDTALSAALRTRFAPLAALSFLVFVLLYTPCIATIGAIKQEFGWPWALTAAGYQTAIAWLAALVIFQGGRLLGFG